MSSVRRIVIGVASVAVVGTRVALRDGARRIRECDTPDANRAANLLKAGVVIPTGLDNSSPIIAAINEDDAFAE